VRLLPSPSESCASIVLFLAEAACSLNLVILRVGFVYGPYVDFGQSKPTSSACYFVLTLPSVSKLIQVSAVYGYMKEPMKALSVLSSLALLAYSLARQALPWQTFDQHRAHR
jgi:hypothetical protein